MNNLLESTLPLHFITRETRTRSEIHERVVYIECKVALNKKFVERRDGSFYVTGSRVPLAQLAIEFQHGESAEAIHSHYPTLSLEQVYGAITFYLGSREDVERDIVERECEEDAYTAAHPTPPEVRMTFERMRQQTVSRRS